MSSQQAIVVYAGAVQGSMCVTPSLTAPRGFQRTVVFVKYTSQWGQQLFLRGGISYDQRPRMTKFD